jgi:hypothetical protein
LAETGFPSRKPYASWYFYMQKIRSTLPRPR